MEEQKEYYIEEIKNILIGIDDIDLIRYLYYFTKLKAEEKAG